MIITFIYNKSHAHSPGIGHLSNYRVSCK